MHTKYLCISQLSFLLGYIFDFSLLFAFSLLTCFDVFFPTFKKTCFMNMLECTLNKNPQQFLSQYCSDPFSGLCFSVFQLQWTICCNTWISIICFVWYCCSSQASNMCFHMHFWGQFWMPSEACASASPSIGDVQTSVRRKR